MPISSTGKEVMKSMMKQYGKKGKSVFYASENKGIPGSKKWTMKDEIKKRTKK
jgi:hypothetical protein